MSEPKLIEIDANGLRFRAFEMGHGPVVLCLHGFPDDAHTWQHQLPAFAAAGYRAIAPFMRGYAPTPPSPNGVYQTAALGRDIVGIIDAVSDTPVAAVVGHDWGALGSCAAALKAPGKMKKLVTAAVPYGPRMTSAFLTNYAQQKRSWYIFFFQTMMAEMAVAHDDLRFIRNLWKEWSPTWDFSDADIEPVLETLRQPGVLEAAIGYYRCLFDPNRLDPELMGEQMMFGIAPIEVPTLYLHGADDGCMGLELLDGMEEAFPAGLTTGIVDGAGHFMHREKANDVNARILEFIGK